MPSIIVRCPKCGTKYTVEETLLGKKGRCKKPDCGHSFRLARSEPDPPKPAVAGSSSPPGGPEAAPVPAANTGDDRPRGDDGIPLTWEPGDVILDLYEVTGVLGEGGMGRVYKVHHRGWNQDLAVKCPRPEVLAKAGGAERFEREAETWVNLGLHPHIAACHYVRCLGGIPRVFVDHLPGGSLADWVRSGRLYEGGPDQALARILDVAIQFAWGLHYAHQRGLVHQDVKPDNVLMTLDGTALVTDFGLARSRPQADDPAQTLSGYGDVTGAAGTRSYQSPEQAAGQRLTHHTDLWSQAVSVVDLFAGATNRGFGVAAPYALEQYLKEMPGNNRLPRMPDELAALLRQCFQPAPGDRPKSLVEAAEVLRALYGLSGSYDKTLRLWEVSSGKCLRTFEGRTNWVTSVSFSPDGRFALSGSMEPLAPFSEAGDKTLRLWEVSSGKCLRTFEGHTSGVKSVSWSPDGRFALSGSNDKTLRLWDVSSGKCLRTFAGHTDVVSSVSWSPDGRFALSGSNDKTLRLWEVSSGKCLRTFDGHTGFVSSVSWSPDRRFALSGSDDDTLRLWEVSSGKCLRTFEGHTFQVYSVSLSPDGRFALSGSHDKTLRLWEVSSGKCLRTFEGHTSYLYSVSWSPDGCCALSGSADNTLRLWGIAFAKQPVPLVTSMAFAVSSPLYRHLLRQVRDSLASNLALGAGFLQQTRQLPGCSRRPDTLELARMLSHSLAHRSFVEGWEKRTFDGHTKGVTSVSWGPGGRFAITGSNDKTLRLWEVSSGKCLRIFEGHTNGEISVSWSPDGRFAVSGSYDKTLRLWEVFSGKCLRTFEGHTNEVTSVSFSPDGRFALSGGWDNTLRLWDVSSGKCLRTFEGHTSGVKSVSWSPDGRFALSSGNAELRLWVVASGNCLRTFKAHAGWVHSVWFSPDGRFALSGGWDNTLRLWEVLSGKCLRTFGGHTFQVDSVSWSPDGRFALSGGWDKTLRLWEVSSGKCLRTFEGHTGVVSSVSFSPDGRFALSGSYDHTLRLWELDWEFEPNRASDWDEGARPHLEAFLSVHTPYAATLPGNRNPTEEEIARALTRGGQPNWTEEDFRCLLDRLGCAGYGWLRPEGVRRELEKMAAARPGPPSLQ